MNSHDPCIENKDENGGAIFMTTANDRPAVVAYKDENGGGIFINAA